MKNAENRSKPDQYLLHLQSGMRENLKAAADANNRSMNSEIVARLENTQDTLTIRDQFAMAALTGLCANSGGPYQANDASGWSLTNCDVSDLVDEAYGIADAMLEARKVKA